MWDGRCVVWDGRVCSVGWECGIGGCVAWDGGVV